MNPRVRPPDHPLTPEAPEEERGEQEGLRPGERGTAQGRPRHRGRAGKHAFDREGHQERGERLARERLAVDEEERTSSDTERREHRGSHVSAKTTSERERRHRDERQHERGEQRHDPLGDERRHRHDAPNQPDPPVQRYGQQRQADAERAVVPPVRALPDDAVHDRDIPILHDRAGDLVHADPVGPCEVPSLEHEERQEQGHGDPGTHAALGCHARTSRWRRHAPAGSVVARPRGRLRDASWDRCHTIRRATRRIDPIPRRDRVGAPEEHHDQCDQQQRSHVHARRDDVSKARRLTVPSTKTPPYRTNASNVYAIHHQARTRTSAKGTGGSRGRTAVTAPCPRAGKLGDQGRGRLDEGEASSRSARRRDATSTTVTSRPTAAC